MEPVAQALQDSIAKGNYQKALTFCDKKLAIDPENKPVKHSKVLCFIQLGKYEEAAAFIKTLDADLKKTLTTETAYTLYKLRQHQEALDTINTIDSPTIAQLHLKGQTYYRLGDHEKCKQIFQTIKEKEDSSELMVNIAAVNCLANTMSKEMKQAQNSNQDSYELAFNVSCLLLQNNELADAEQQLLLAEKIAKEILPQQEYTEKEIIDELAGIKVQLAYIYQLTNREAEAIELYESVLKNKPSDASVMAVASNNVVTLHKDHKLFNAEKNLFNAISAADDHKLTTEQEKIINFNRAVVYLKMGKVDKCREIVDTLKKDFPKSPLPALIEAALLLKEKQTEEAEALLKEKAEQGNLTTKLTLAQLLLKDGKVQECIKALQDLGDDSFRLGVVATCVKLYSQLDDISAAVKILLASGEFKSSNDMHAEAAECFKRLVDLDKENSQYYVSKLVISLSFVNPEAAASYAENLPASSLSYEGISVDKLENISAHRSTRESKEDESESQALDKKKKKKKRKKKKRLPKNYDPNTAPDPERWLPRNQRSTYKKRKNKMRGRHQGQDMGGSEPVKNEPKKPAQTKPTTPQPQPKGKKQKKGKKKGGRR